MNARLALIAALIVAGLATSVALYATSRLVRTTHTQDCPATKQAAQISQRAAQICTAELVGCSLSHEQIKQILAEQEAAKACP